MNVARQNRRDRRAWNRSEKPTQFRGETWGGPIDTGFPRVTVSTKSREPQKLRKAPILRDRHFLNR